MFFFSPELHRSLKYSSGRSVSQLQAECGSLGAVASPGAILRQTANNAENAASDRLPCILREPHQYASELGRHHPSLSLPPPPTGVPAGSSSLSTIVSMTSPRQLLVITSRSKTTHWNLARGFEISSDRKSQPS